MSAGVLTKRARAEGDGKVDDLLAEIDENGQCRAGGRRRDTSDGLARSQDISTRAASSRR
jgi:hypothetical protein